MVDPKAIDKQIADTEFEIQSLRLRIANTEKTVEQYRKQAEKCPHSATRADEHELILKSLVSEHAPLINKLINLNNQYTGWTRAFLVINSNGHIHKNRSCSTCFDTTQFYWLTDLSGDDEMTIVEKAGEKACTVCYPDAPSEYLARKTQLEHPDVVKARAEREAKKAEREAKRLKTGIWNADGSPLKVYENSWSRYRYEVKTERTAIQIAVDHYLWLSDERERDVVEQSNVQESLREIVSALAVKHDTDFDTEFEKIELKGLKKQIAQAKATAKWLANNPQ